MLCSPKIQRRQSLGNLRRRPCPAPAVGRAAARDSRKSTKTSTTAAVKTATIRIAEFIEGPCEMATARYRSTEPLKEGWVVNHILTKLAEPAMPLNPCACSKLTGICSSIDRKSVV